MKFLRSKIFIISTVVVLVIGGGVYAFMHFTDHHRYAVGRLMDRMDHELNLSDAQHQQIETILVDTVQRFRQGRGSRFDSAAALLNQPTLTEEQVREAIEAQRPVNRRADMEALMAGTLVRVHAVLTPEQRGELAAVIEQRMHHDWFRGRHRNRHFGHHWLH